MGRRTTQAKDTYNEELISWASSNLSRVPLDENYKKMISGMPYVPTLPHYLKARHEVHGRSADYAQMRVWNHKSPEDFDKARDEYVRKYLLGQVGENVYIEAPVYLDYGYNISVGNNFYANFNATLLDCSVIQIGNDVMLGSNVTITTASHPLEAAVRVNGTEFAQPVKIGNRVWIASNALILPGVTIGDDAVIAAGAVVSKDVAPSVVVAGVPAKVIREIHKT